LFDRGSALESVRRIGVTLQRRRLYAAPIFLQPALEALQTLLALFAFEDRFDRERDAADAAPFREWTVDAVLWLRRCDADDLGLRFARLAIPRAAAVGRVQRRGVDLELDGV